MKGIFISTLLCVATIQVFSQTLKVRYDGLYQTQTKGDSRDFLRFYSDNIVLSVGTRGEVRDLIKWFKKPYNRPSDCRGKYEIINDKIYFTTTSSAGTVVYEGIIETKFKLRLKKKSLINGYEEEEVYYFIKF